MKKLLRWLLILFVAQWIAAWGLSLWARKGLLNILPEGTRVGAVQWRWPIGVRMHDLVLPDPAEEREFLLKLKRGDFTIPVWSAWVRPTPVRMKFISPHVQMHSGNLYPVVQGIGIPSQRWLPVPLWEMEEQGGPRFPFVPLSLEIVNGRLDAFGAQIQAERPVFAAANVDLNVGLTFSGVEPVIRLAGSGIFVSEKGEPIGLQQMSAELYPQRRYGKGSLRLRHERLGDFQKIYEYAPRPILIDSGMADTKLEAEIIDGRHLNLVARCQVQNLDMRGPVGDVDWGQIMHAVEDEQRRYEWEVHVEGEIDDPTFNPHDTILREVEFLMKEKAAARGLAIKEQMFFYADTPGGTGPAPADQGPTPQALRPSAPDRAAGLDDQLSDALQTGLEEGVQVLAVEDLARKGPLALRLAAEVAERKRAGVALLPVEAVPAASKAFEPTKIELWIPASAQKIAFNHLIPSSFLLADKNPVHYLSFKAADVSRELREAARGAEAEGKTVVAVLYENLYLELLRQDLLVPGIIILVVHPDTLDRTDRTQIVAAYLSQPDLLRGAILDLTSGSPIPKVTLDDKKENFAVDRWV